MTQEYKLLLFKDLCMRLPYGVKVHGVFLNYNKYKDKILYEECDEELNYEHLNRYESLKPYLRPMSSMTEEESKEFIKVACYDITESVNGRHYEYYLNDCVCTVDAPTCNYEAIDWLLRNHFDFRGLIPKGLAIEVTPDNNPYK